MKYIHSDVITSVSWLLQFVSLTCVQPLCACLSPLQFTKTYKVVSLISKLAHAEGMRHCRYLRADNPVCLQNCGGCRKNWQAARGPDICPSV